MNRVLALAEVSGRGGRVDDMSRVGANALEGSCQQQPSDLHRLTILRRILRRIPGFCLN